MEMHVYLASGWFTEDQKELHDKVKDILEANYFPCRESDDFIVFYPSEQTQPASGTWDSSWANVLESNCEQIRRADIVIALISTTPDLGVAWECGYAAALGKKILLISEEAHPNLMLQKNALILRPEILNEDGEEFRDLLRLLKKNLNLNVV